MGFFGHVRDMHWKGVQCRRKVSILYLYLREHVLSRLEDDYLRLTLPSTKPPSRQSKIYI